MDNEKDRETFQRERQNGNFASDLYTKKNDRTMEKTEMKTDDISKRTVGHFK